MSNEDFTAEEVAAWDEDDGPVTIRFTVWKKNGMLETKEKALKTEAAMRKWTERNENLHEVLSYHKPEQSR